MLRGDGRIAGAKWPPWRGQSAKWPEYAALVRPTTQDLSSRRAARWPVPAHWLVRFVLTDKPVAVDVELYVDEGRATVTGVAVRTTVATDPNGSAKDPWKERADFSALSLRARDLQRLPLATYAKAARVLVADPLGTEGTKRAVRALSRKPPRERGTAFYADLLDRRQELEAAGETEPAAWIAREMGEKPGTVRVWLHRAKKREEKMREATRDTQGGEP